MNIIYMVVIALAGASAGIIATLVARKMAKQRKRRRARSEAEKIVSKAKYDAQKIEKDARHMAKEAEKKARRGAENEIQKQRQELSKAEKTFKQKQNDLERNVKNKERTLDEKSARMKEKSEKIDILEKRLLESEDQIHEKIGEFQEKLKHVAQMTKDEAKADLVTSLTEEAEHDAAKKIVMIENEAKADAENRAKRVISLAISRYAGEYATERTVSVVALPSDEMKGRIIGREGRNIRALEAACGVDLIIDDTPEAIVISGFDPVRREISRRVLERLMDDGRIHPARIEEITDKVKKELFKSIKTDGEKACFDLNIHGVNPEIIKLVGSLKYRTSYSQNNYSHSIEVGFLAGMMAAELGGDMQVARRAGLLHDIGKALDHSVEGSHAVIGAEFAKKHGEKEVVCHPIRSHHEDEKPRTILAHLVTAADALSGARPGARRQMMESYVRRLEDLESIGNSFDGVIRTFALQAGREVRVVVESSKVTDEQSIMLSRDIARKIERELQYPGQIKICVVRETRAVDHAR